MATPDTPWAGIYVLDPFSTQNPNASQQAQIAADAVDLQNSGFGVIILASFHVSEAGDINFNNTTIAQNGAVTDLLDPDLATLLSNMKTEGKVRSILMSFGGGGTFSGQAIGYWDFLHVKNLIAAFPNPNDNPFFKNLQAIFQAYPIDGLDLDLEVYENQTQTYAEFTSTLVTIINWCAGNASQVTLCPFQAYSFWVNVLVETYVNNVQQVSWVNLQNADSGGVTDFVNTMNGQTTGVSNPVGFISAGLQIDGYPSSMVQQNFSSLNQSNPGLYGGWVWNFSSISPSDSGEYASAILDGFGA